MAVPSNRTFYYREGEVFVRELARFLDHSGAEGSPVEVRVAAEFVTATNRQARARARLRNTQPFADSCRRLVWRQVRARQLWGTDVYTEDSDLVACLVHTGFYKLTSASAPLGLIELRATLRPVAGQPGAPRAPAPRAPPRAPASPHPSSPRQRTSARCATASGRARGAAAPPGPGATPPARFGSKNVPPS